MAPLRRDREERVRILVGRVASVEAVVARVVPGAAELRVLRSPAVPLRFLHRRTATLVPARGTGDALEGLLLAVADGRGRLREDRLHFLEDVGPAASPSAPAPARNQRRAHARVDVIRPVAMVPDGFTVGWLTGSTRNLSAGGVLVAGAEALERGDRLRVRIELDHEDELLDLLARVARADDRYGLRGLRLEGVSAAERERIVRYVFAAQRAALARERARRLG